MPTQETKTPSIPRNPKPTASAYRQRAGYSQAISSRLKSAHRFAAVPAVLMTDHHADVISRRIDAIGSADT